MQEELNGTKKPLSQGKERIPRQNGTNQGEYSAVVQTVLLLGPDLEGHKFARGKNHEALMWIHNIADATGRLVRWRILMSEIDYDVKYRGGIKIQAANALSQPETGGKTSTELGNDL